MRNNSFLWIVLLSGCCVEFGLAQEGSEQKPLKEGDLKKKKISESDAESKAKAKVEVVDEGEDEADITAHIDALKDSDVKAREKAESALKKLRSRAVPFIEKSLEADTSKEFVKRAKRILEDIRLIESMLTAIREGKSIERNSGQKLLAYLNSYFVVGNTTLAEVKAVLGDKATDLDRPKRDAITTIQYSLWGGYSEGSGEYLILDFDKNKNVFSSASLSYWVCGYCPHVFAYDDSWRLEGKQLAGCVGKARSGSDVLLLPRLKAVQGMLSVKLSNLAPEVEYINKVALTQVALKAGEELDVTVEGGLAVWKPVKEISGTFEKTRNGGSSVAFVLDRRNVGNVLVLEIRNTLAFEEAMRAQFLHDQEVLCAQNIKVAFKNGAIVEVKPVGTKFLRRIVLSIPEAAEGVTISTAGGFWQIRRMWIGKSVESAGAIIWRAANSNVPIQLRPEEEEIYRFKKVRDNSSSLGVYRFGYALRIHGYYEFLSAGQKGESVPLDGK